jgi:hypothetical protein
MKLVWSRCFHRQVHEIESGLISKSFSDVFQHLQTDDPREKSKRRIPNGDFKLKFL